MQQRRRYERRRESLPMSVKPATGETKTYTTRDIGDSGIFLFAMDTEQLPVGMEVLVAPVRSAADTPPTSIKGRVVRTSAQGMGIEFIEPSFS